MKDLLLIGGAAVAAWLVLWHLNQTAYAGVAATCNAQCPPPAFWIPADAPLSQPGAPVQAVCPCSAYTQFQTQWGWFEPFVPHIEL